MNDLEYPVVAEEFCLCVSPILSHKRYRKEFDVWKLILILFQNCRVDWPVTVFGKDLLRRVGE